jgi:hypothetical protein
MTKSNAQLWIAVAMVVLWGVGLIVAAFDGSEMVKIMTPMMTLMLGWLFTDHATS